MVEKFDFINLKYKPKNDLVCLFRITPNKISMKKAANTVALESSIGTWTKVKSSKSYVEKLRAKVFSINAANARNSSPRDIGTASIRCVRPVFTIW